MATDPLELILLGAAIANMKVLESPVKWGSYQQVIDEVKSGAGDHPAIDTLLKQLSPDSLSLQPGENLLGAVMRIHEQIASAAARRTLIHQLRSVLTRMEHADKILEYDQCRAELIDCAEQVRKLAEEC